MREEYDRVMKGGCIIRSLARIMRVRNVSMEVNRFKEQYYSTKIDIWIKDFNME